VTVTDRLPGLAKLTDVQVVGTGVGWGGEVDLLDVPSGDGPLEPPPVGDGPAPLPDADGLVDSLLGDGLAESPVGDRRDEAPVGDGLADGADANGLVDVLPVFGACAVPAAEHADRATAPTAAARVTATRPVDAVNVASRGRAGRSASGWPPHRRAPVRAAARRGRPVAAGAPTAKRR